MAASANKAGGITDPGSADPAVALRTEAMRQPQPLARWLASVAASGRAMRGGGVKEQITAAFKAGGGVGALCPQVVTGKYPFMPGADKDASLDEFGSLFGAGGVLDAFFNTQLKPYVDASGRAWKLQPVEGASAPIAPSDLQQFQRAAAIRDMFFSGGGTAAKLRFDLTPLGAEPGGTSATLDLGSATLQATSSTTPGPPRPVQITWPPAKPGPVSLSWSPRTHPRPARERAVGAVPAVRPRQRRAVGRGPAVLTLHDGERSARFEVRSALNPFASPLLQEFRCPNSAIVPSGHGGLFAEQCRLSTSSKGAIAMARALVSAAFLCCRTA